MGKRGKCDDYVKIQKTNVVKKRKYINQLKREIRCLERANKTYQSVATELETWKENFIENEKKLEAYRKMNSNGSLVEKKLDCVVLEDMLKGKVLASDEQNDYKIKYGELLLRMKRLEDDQILCSMSEYDKVVQLETENKELGIGNRRLQEEVNVCEKVMQACKVKSNELSALLDEKKMECVVLEDKCKDLRLSKLVVDDELKNYKTKCVELEERITQVEADGRVICEKEKKGQEEILFLLHENGKLVQLETENRELELGKCRLQDEINNWSKKFQEMETQVSRIVNEGALEKAKLKEELAVYRSMSQDLQEELEKKRIQFIASTYELKALTSRKNSVDKELNECKTVCIQLKQRTAQLEKDKNLMSGKEKRAQEIIAQMSAEIKKEGSDRNEEYVKLKAAYADLERGKHSAQEEISRLRKSLADSKTEAAFRLTQEVKLQSDLDDWKFQFNQLSEKLEEQASTELKLSEGLKKASDETEMWKERFGEMKKISETYRCESDELSLKLEEKTRECSVTEVKLSDLKSRKNSVDFELHEYKKTSNVLKEMISCFEEEHKVICETERGNEEKITNLSEELKKARDESVMWKKMYEEMKNESEACRCKCDIINEREKVLLPKEELAVCRSQETPMQLEKKIMQFNASGYKFEALTLAQETVDSELNECKTVCNELKERIARLEKNISLMSGKEKRAQERIAELSAELKKKEGGGLAEYVKLKAAHAALEHGKQSAEEEIKILRKSVADLKNQASSRLKCEVESQKNLDDCKFQCHQLSLKLEEKNSECLASEVKLKDLTSSNSFVVYELNEYKKAADVLKKRISQLEEDLKDIFETEKQAQEKIIHLYEELKKAGEDTKVWKEICEEMKKESEAYKCKCGELCLNLEENKRKSGNYDVMYERETVVQQSITKFEETRILEREKPDLIKTYTSGSAYLQSEVSHKAEENKDNSHMAVTGVSSVTMMCNASINVESKKNIPPVIELDGIIDISDSEDELPPSERRFNRPLPGQRCDENWSNLKEDSPLSSTRKRKWVSATGSSEQGIEEDIIMKKFNAHKDENPKRFSLTMCSRIPNASFGGQHVEENKSSTEGETLNHLQTSGSLHEKTGNTCMGDTENVLEDVHSNGESENYGAHTVKGGLHLDDNQIKLIQGNQSNWKFVADMLSSFEEDPELSMKAVCALCRQQTLQEKSEQDLGYNAKRGFGAFYVIRGTEIAAFLMDGDREGGLKKSIEELNLWDRKALEECKMLARIHSNQLFRIYKAKEDPFFLPSSAN